LAPPKSNLSESLGFSKAGTPKLAAELAAQKACALPTQLAAQLPAPLATKLAANCKAYTASCKLQSWLQRKAAERDAEMASCTMKGFRGVFSSQ